MNAYYDDDRRAGRGFHGGLRGRGFGRGMPGARGRGRDGSVRRGGGRRLDADALGTIVLSLLGEAPRHGHELLAAIAERNGGGYAPTPGAVYPTLAMLEDMALIAVQQSDDGCRRYALNAAGEAHLAERKDQADALFARLAAAGTRDVTPVRRAMGNLRAVLHNRLGRDGLDAAMRDEAVALIEAVAQRIERL